MASKPKDLYMNWAPFRCLLSAGDPRTLNSEDYDTNLSIRGGLAWLIHRVEISFPTEQAALASHSNIIACLCTVKDLATMPTIKDKGVISRMSRTMCVAAGGGLSTFEDPLVMEFLPPMPLAAPNISLYVAETMADHAAIEGKPVDVRIGYTTVEMDNALYLEIAETWGQ